MIIPVLSDTYSSNCYFVVGEKTALVDAGADPALIFVVMEREGLKADYLINTHSHFDHIGADLSVKEKTGAMICAHEKDAAYMEEGNARRILSDWFGSRNHKVKVDLRLKDGQTLDLGGVLLEVIYTPGHTVGGICLYEPESRSLFSGDTVFADGVGRIDLEGGSMKDLKESLEKLARLHDERGVDTLYPGHGPTGSGEDIKRMLEAYF